MVKEGMVLGHRISDKGIEVDRAKVEVIERLSPPISVKSVRCFWDMQAFTGCLVRISHNLHILYANYLRNNVNFILMNPIRKHLES